MRFSVRINDFNIKYMTRILVSAFLVLWIFSSCDSNKIDNSEKPFKRVDKALYLSKGKIYCYDFEKKKTNELRLTRDSILNFTISPTRQYIAFEKLMKYVDTPGVYESMPPKEPLGAIVIYDVLSNKTIKEILPGNYEFLSIRKWIDKDEILYASGDQFAVNGWLTYRVNDSIVDIGYSEKQNEFESIIFSKDFSTKVFIDSLNAVHMVDVVSRYDNQLFNTSHLIGDFEMSNDKSYLASFEIKNTHDSISKRVITTDIVYLLSLKDNSTEKLYEGPAVGGAKKLLNFSFNDSILSVELERRIMLLNIYTKQKLFIEGLDTHWIDAQTLIYNKSNDLYLFDLKTNKSILFQKNANNLEPINYSY